MSLPILAGMAVVPWRVKNIHRSLPGIASRVDTLFVHLNDSDLDDSLFEKLKEAAAGHTNVVFSRSAGERGDIAKLCGLFPEAFGIPGEPAEDCYYLCLDDDIVYPDNYAARMIAFLKSMRPEGIVCVHGSIFDPRNPRPGVINRRKMFDFRRPMAACRNVLMPGTGTAVFRAGKLQLCLDDLETANMLDVWVACLAAARELPVMCVARSPGWLGTLPAGGKAICRGCRPAAAIDKAVDKYRNELIGMFRELPGQRKV